MLLWKILSVAAFAAAGPIEALEHYTRAVEARCKFSFLLPHAH